MVDRGLSIISMIIVGGVAIRIVTNKNAQGFVSAIFHGGGEVIHDSFGS
jgi:hypothetical protein